MMAAHVLRGTKQQIAQDLAQIPGEVREAIVFVEEPAPIVSGAPAHDSEDIFAEMRPFMVDVQFVDDSREAIYTPMERK
jgi:hypothetical protein